MRAAIRGIDALLRRCEGIFDYNSSGDCIFRASMCRIGAPSFLPPTLAAGGKKMLELHFHGDRMPSMPPGGPDLAYAKKLTRMAANSFRLLAEYLLQDPRAADVGAVGGITNLFFSGNIAAGKKIFNRLGLHIERHRSRAGVVRRFFIDLYAWMLMWTYNPQILRARRPLEIEWYAFWISRSELAQRYATAKVRCRPNPGESGTKRSGQSMAASERS